MIGRRLDSIEAVVSGHLCTGCGVCTYLEPRLHMQEFPNIGRRPVPIVEITGGVRGEAVEACPGRGLAHTRDELAGAPFGGTWGPVIALFECWSTDPKVRHRGSSGGVVSALAMHAIESGTAAGVLQVRARADAPLLNETVLNTTPEAVASSAGSRYAPASPGERLDLVEGAAGPCVVIGKPCDIAGTRVAANQRPALNDKIGLTIGIFCAGTPSTRTTEKMITSLGVTPETVSRLDYRGEGWPGHFRVETASGDRAATTYADAWDGTLSRGRQWRCMICPDHTGEFADLSVGDPWYRKLSPDEPGRSLVVVRTERGRAALARALANGALEGNSIPLDLLPASQPSLEATRGALWARIITLRIAGVAAPRFKNLPSARLWLGLSFRQKLSSVLGTIKRIRVKELRKPESDKFPARRAGRQ